MATLEIIKAHFWGLLPHIFAHHTVHRGDFCSRTMMAKEAKRGKADIKKRKIKEGGGGGERERRRTERKGVRSGSEAKKKKRKQEREEGEK